MTYDEASESPPQPIVQVLQQILSLEYLKTISLGMLLSILVLHLLINKFIKFWLSDEMVESCGEAPVPYAIIPY